MVPHRAFCESPPADEEEPWLHGVHVGLSQVVQLSLLYMSKFRFSCRLDYTQSLEQSTAVMSVLSKEV